MEKIITLPKLQLFLTKCKTIFALKKHTHTASDITGLPSGGGADSTRYTVDEHGYTVIKDKYGNDAFWANGVNRELRDSKGNTAVRVKNPEALPNDLGGGVEINYGKNANGAAEKAIVTSDSNLQIKTPDGNTVARIEDGKTSWKTPTSTTDAIQLTPAKSQLKFNNKGLEVKESKATLTHEKEVLLNSEAGATASLRLSEKDVHLDGIDGGMMLSSRASLPTDSVSYDMNLPLKDKLGDAAPATPPVKGIRLHKWYVELTGPDNSIYGDYIYIGDGESSIDIEGQYINFTYGTDIKVDGDIVPSIFPTRTMPDLNKLGVNQGHVFVVPDEELTYRYMYDHVENICVFRNESNTMCFLKNGSNVIQPLPFPVFVSATDEVMGMFDDDFMFYAYNDFTNKWELYYNIQVEEFTTQYPDDGTGRFLFEKFTTMPVGSDGGMLGHCNTVSLSRALVLLAQVAENQGMANN